MAEDNKKNKDKHDKPLNARNAKFAVVRTAFHGGGIIGYYNDPKEVARAVKENKVPDCDCGCCEAVTIKDEDRWLIGPVVNMYSKAIYMLKDVPYYREGMRYNKICRRPEKEVLTEEQKKELKRLRTRILVDVNRRRLISLNMYVTDDSNFVTEKDIKLANRIHYKQRPRHDNKLCMDNARFAVLRTAKHGGGAIGFYNSLSEAYRLEKATKIKGCRCGCSGVVPITDDALREMTEKQGLYYGTIRTYDDLPRWSAGLEPSTLCTLESDYDEYPYME